METTPTIAGGSGGDNALGAAAGAFADGVIALSDQQQHVVQFAGRALLVIGVAGSGKTVALIERVAALVSRGVAPESILVLSPARESAKRLREMLGARVPVARSGVWARTAQSFAFEVVNAFARDSGEAPVRLMTGGEQEQLIGDLLAGHESTGAGPSWPSWIGPEVRSLRGFRHELRDVIDQCSEYGVGPDALRASGRDEWTAVSDFLREYREVVSAVSPMAVSAPDLVSRAARHLSSADSWPESVARIRHVLIDDSQELTESVALLVGGLVLHGASVVSFGDPDTATNEFRGGKPELAATLGEVIGVPCEILVLDSSFRLTGQIAEAMGRVTASIGAARQGTQRRALLDNHAGGSEATVSVYSSPSSSAAAIASRLRRRHLIDGVPWHELAVIVRSGAVAEGLVRSLEACGVPIHESGRPQLFREHVATEPLVTAAALACGVVPRTASTYMHLLGSYVGDMDAIALRRLRRALRREELEGGGNRTADELLVEAFSVAGGFASIDMPVARSAERFAQRLTEAGRIGADGTAEDVLWSLWNSTMVHDRDGVRGRVDETWRDMSLSGDTDSSGLSRNLDTVVALFATASRYTEQNQGSPPSEFFAEQLERHIADDIIVPSVEVDAVWIGTPPQTIGRDFDTVVISGVDDGVWPDLRLRDTLLGAGDISSLSSVGGSGTIDRRREVLNSELRLFARAVSRARHAVHVTAIDSDDEKPSPLVYAIDPSLRGTETAAEPGERHPFTLRGIVGQLRRELVAPASSTTRLEAAAGLGVLARENILGARPDQWQGLIEASTSEPIRDFSPERPVPISPSGIGSFESCPLSWFLDKYGGNDTGTAAAMGTIVHAALEVAGDQVDRRDLGDYVDSRWSELEFEAQWHSQQERARADVMLDKLVAYLADAQRAGNSRLAAEVRFAAPGNNYELRGSIDRIETTSDGELVVVDLKTGVPPVKSEVVDNPQLGSYQLAIVEGLPNSDQEIAVEPGTRVREAKLLFVKTNTQTYAVHTQDPLTDEGFAEFRRRLETVAEGMSGSVFAANIEQHCYGFNHTQCAIHLVPAVTE